MRFLIKNKESGKYLTEYSLDKDLGFFGFHRLSRIIAGLNQPSLFESYEAASFIVSKLQREDYCNGDEQEYELVDVDQIGLMSLKHEMQLAIRELGVPRKTSMKQRLDIYLVRLNRKRKRYDLRPLSNTASATHAMTCNPTSGDLIDYALSCCVLKHYSLSLSGLLTLERGEAELRLDYCPGKAERIVLASADNSLEKFWLEKLNGADWDYAGIEISTIPKPEDGAELDKWLKIPKLKASCSAGRHGRCKWQLAENLED